MSELRLNLVTGDWVIIATDRASRPGFFDSATMHHQLPEHDAACPFCPGNETMSSTEILRLPATGAWQQRVVPNKFPALSPDTKPMQDNRGRMHRIGGFGSHEVIIEGPRHDKTVVDFDTEQVVQILEVYQARFIALYQIAAVKHVIIFKNHGRAAGTSLDHPHSQLIATPVVPVQVQERMQDYESYFEKSGECLMCSTLTDELKDGRRIIIETEHFVSFIPYAALSPLHLWLFPRRHESSFGRVNHDELQDLAGHLQQLLKLLRCAAGDLSFNYTIRSDSMQSNHKEYAHWYLSIVPRVSQAAGFEMGSGMYINSSIPEESAAFLQKFLPQI